MRLTYLDVNIFTTNRPLRNSQMIGDLQPKRHLPKDLSPRARELE